MPPDEPQSAAVKKLRDELARAGRVYAANLPAPNHRRAAVVYALSAVDAFLTVALDDVDEPLRHEMLVPLSAITMALCDLERGPTSPLLEPARVGGRPPDPHGREMTKGAAAAVMSLLMDGGHNREEAARRVARELLRVGVKLEGQRELNWRTVASWRDQVMKAGPARDDTGMCETYRHFMACYALPDGLGEGARARYLDQMLSCALGWLLAHGGS